jgi:D-xylose transport system permease protein
VLVGEEMTVSKVEPDPMPADSTDTATEPAQEPYLPTDEAAAPYVPAEIMAQTLPEYLRALWLRVKSGESGQLPVVLAMIAVLIVFQIVSPHHVFLTAGNLVNLFQQSAVYIVLAMAEIFVLLLGEIDLSLGYVGAIGGVIGVQLVEPRTTNWPWWAAIIIALLACAVMGAFMGLLISLLRLPSFIVTLAGLIAFNGVMLIVLGFGPFSGYPPLQGNQRDIRTLYNLMWGRITPAAGWIVMAVVVAGLGAALLMRDTQRRRSGLVAPPVALTWIKIGFMAAAGIVVVLICNTNRAHFGKLEGVPWVILIVLGVLGIYTFLLQRMRYGRYIYAIGGNAEAARRAGINVPGVRTVAFILCSTTGGIAGLLYASYLGGVSNNVNGGQLVLYAVAAAVIGGTSLFGGRGRVVHGITGGLLIGGIANGMGLLGLQVQWQFIVTGGVLLFAVIVDALSRRGASSGSITRV